MKHTSSPSYTLEELALLLQAEMYGDPKKEIFGVAALESATDQDLSFLANLRYEEVMKESKAAAIIIATKEQCIDGKNFLIVTDPHRAFQKIIELFSKEKMGPPFACFPGIHPTAVIHEGAKIGQDVQIGPYTVIEAGAAIGARTIIGPLCSIGQDVFVGEDCLFYQHVTIREGCRVGNRVVMQPGSVIGSCGFGFTTDKSGRHTKLNQVGIVIVEDDVEIGANTTIDRARFEATVIGQGSKIDNLVQIAHNVKVGKHNLIVSQAGIAGSSETGDFVVLAGKVAVNGHIKIHSQVMVAACSGVSKSITKPGKYGGVPAMPLAEYNRMAVHLQNIGDVVADVKELKQTNLKKSSD